MRATSFLSRFVVVSVLVASALAEPLKPKDLERWTRVSSPNFEVYCQRDESRGRDILSKLEMSRQMIVVQQGVQELDKTPLTLFAFSEEDTYERVISKSIRDMDPAGFFANHPDRSRVVLAPAISPEYIESVVFHEYVHFLTKASRLRLPTWLNEGLAEVYSKCDFSKDQLDYALPKKETLKYLAENVEIPMRKLVAITHDSEEYTDRSLQGLFYARSWLAVHFLLCSGKGLPEGSAKTYIGWLSDNPYATPAEQESAFNQIFKMSYEDMDALIRRYYAKRRYTFVRVNLPGSATASSFKSTDVSEEEMRLKLASLRSIHRGDLVADPELETLASAGNAEALEFRGSCRFVGEDPRSAFEDWKQAIKAGSTNPALLRNLNLALLLPLVAEYKIAETVPNDEIAEARQRALTALAREPEDYIRLEELAALEAFSLKPDPGAVNLVRKNFAKVKNRRMALLLMATAYWRAGRPADANTLLEVLVKEDPEGDFKSEVEKLRMELGHAST